MANVMVSAASQVVKLRYDSGKIFKLADAYKDGLDEIFKGPMATHRTGLDGIQFMLESGFPGAGGSLAEGDNVVGTVGNETLSRTEFAKHITKLRRWADKLALSHEAIYFKKDDRIAAGLFAINLKNFTIKASAIDYWNTHTGASGWLVRVGSGTKTNVTGNRWRIPIDVTIHSGSHRYAQKTHALLKGFKVEVVAVADGTVLTSGGNDYSGTIASVSADGASLDITWDQAMASTNSDLTNSYVVRFRRRTGLIEKYGLVDWVGDENSVYIDEAGSTDNWFPYSTGETGIDPAAEGDWNSNIHTYSGSFSVSDFDEMWERHEQRCAGFSMSQSDYAILTSPSVATQLIQEQRADKRYRPSDRNDQDAQGRDLYDGKTPVFRSRACPEGVVYLLDRRSLSMDVEQKMGLRFSQNPNMGGSFNGEIFQQMENSLDFYCKAFWYGQKMTLLRKHHSRLQKA